MAGHSKWSNIKRKKEKTDAQKGKLFSKAAREVTMAAKIGGEDPEQNARLRLAIQKAKEVNMPNDNIQRAILKGAGKDGDAASLEEVTFEAYATNGVALLIETLTDNRNRTVPNLKNILNKGGGSMATIGSVSYMFNQKGVIIFEPGSPTDTIIDIATESNAEDIDIKDDESIEVISAPNDLEQIKTAFETKEISFATCDLLMIPDNYVSTDSETAKKILSLIDKLEEDDDVQNVHSNLDFPEEILLED